MFYYFCEDLVLPFAFGSSSLPWAPQGPPQNPSPQSCEGWGPSCHFFGQVGRAAHPWMGERGLHGHLSSQSWLSGSVACLEEIRDLSAANPMRWTFFHPHLHFLVGLLVSKMEMHIIMRVKTRRISAHRVPLCQLFQESLLPLIIIAGSSILGLMRFTPITVARLSTLILLTLEFNCISCRNLPECKGKYFKSEKEDCKKPYTPTGIKSWLIHPAFPLSPRDRNR